MSDAEVEPADGTDTGDRVLLSGRWYSVLGRVTVRTEDPYTVVLGQCVQYYMTVRCRGGATIEDVALVSTSMREILAGFAVRCGAPADKIYQSL